ncbi:MAG TPA: XdhC family protein, partial [Minicystis sp.]|nr:XdhC family protein [Minicystis sp.]
MTAAFRELCDVVTAHAALARAGRPAVLATVVDARGSTYRRPGARMLLGEDDVLAGGVSGGCVEHDLLRKAWFRTRGGGPVLVTYDAAQGDDGDAAWAFGLGCDGAIDVLLERVVPGAPGDPVAPLRRVIEARAPGALVTVIRGDARAARIGERLVLLGGDVVACTLAAELVGAALPLARRAL